MIGRGHPTSKENTKELRKNGAVLFFATDTNLLYAREDDGEGGSKWIVLGHVVALDAPLMNRPLYPALTGHPSGSRR
jgi:hypothetical protein